METLLQLAAVSEMRLNQSKTLEKTKQGPVVLVERGVKPAAILVSPEQWNETALLIKGLQEELNRERRLRLSNQRYAARLADPARGVTQEQFDQKLGEANL